MTCVGLNRLGFLLHDVQRLMRRRFEQRASGFGLSSAQWRLLACVSKEEGVAQARLAEMLDIEPISVSRHVDRMEEAGWIERRHDPSDRRVRTLHPTQKARAASAEVKEIAGAVYEEALAGMDGKQRDEFIGWLETIAANLSEESFSGARAGNGKATAG